MYTILFRHCRRCLPGNSIYERRKAIICQSDNKPGPCIIYHITILQSEIQMGLFDQPIDKQTLQ
jgi:hypothetical protein